MLDMLTMAALLQLIPEPGLPWAAFFSRGRNACGEWKERHAQRRLVGRHVSFHSGSYQSSRIREQLLADISVDHLVQPPQPKQSHQEPIAQDHVQVTFGISKEDTGQYQQSACANAQPPSSAQNKGRGQILVPLAQIMILCSLAWARTSALLSFQSQRPQTPKCQIVQSTDMSHS